MNANEASASFNVMFEGVALIVGCEGLVVAVGKNERGVYCLRLASVYCGGVGGINREAFFCAYFLNGFNAGSDVLSCTYPLPSDCVVAGVDPRMRCNGRRWGMETEDS